LQRRRQLLEPLCRLGGRWCYLLVEVGGELSRALAQTGDHLRIEGRSPRLHSPRQRAQSLAGLLQTTELGVVEGLQRIAQVAHLVYGLVREGLGPSEPPFDLGTRWQLQTDGEQQPGSGDLEQAHDDQKGATHGEPRVGTGKAPWRIC